MLVAIRIWIKLRRSIPPGLRKYYSLIPDPTAGTVTVVARMPTLNVPGLWSIYPTNARSMSPPSEKKGSYNQLHSSIVAMGMPLAAPSTAMMARNAARNNSKTSPSSLPITRQHLLGRTWISLVDHYGLDLKKPHHSEDGDSNDLSDDEDARFVVASDMKASDRTPLKMSWAQFVWLALALGISAYDPTWQSSYPCTFKNVKNEDIIHLSYEDDRLSAKFPLRGTLTYSLRRAFAWYNIKLDSDRLSPLGHSKSAQVCLDSVTISPELSACRLGMNLTSQGCSNIIRGKEPQDATNALATTCCWMIYWHDHCLESDGSLSVSQSLLEHRQQVLCRLKRLDDREDLAPKVRSLVLAKTVDGIATQHNANSATALHMTTQMSETTLSHQDLPAGSTADIGAPGGEQPVEDVPLSTRDEGVVAAILKQLRSSFASSEYVRKHAELYKVIEQVQTELKRQRSWGWVKEIWRQRADFPTPSVKETLQPTDVLMTSGEGMPQSVTAAFERLQMTLKTLNSHLTQTEQSASSESKKRLYDLIPPHLRAELERAVKAWELCPDRHSVGPWREVDSIGFLACVALALTDWDHYRLETRPLRDDLHSLIEELAAVLSDVLKKKRDKKIWGPKHINRLTGIFGEITSWADILGKGLYMYAAPSEHPVSRLLHLREKDAVVCLL
jgi:hypothetical protein